MAFGFDESRQNGYLINSASYGGFRLVRIENGQYDPGQSVSWHINYKEETGLTDVTVVFDRTGSHPRFDITILPPSQEPKVLQMVDTGVSSDFGGGLVGFFAYTNWEFDGTSPTWPYPVEGTRPYWTQHFLEVLPVLTADVNGDGRVNTDDLGILLAHWGDSGSHIGWAQGDFTGDGRVNTDDLGILLAHWGSATASAVPEPSGLALLALGGLALRRRR